MDIRHQQRIVALQQLFTTSFSGTDTSRIHNRHPIVASVSENIQEIDAMVQKHAPRYPIHQLSKVDLAILRLSIYELMYAKLEPERVIIDEAVRLSKEFSSEKSYSFINGVLGAVVKDVTQKSAA